MANGGVSVVIAGVVFINLRAHATQLRQSHGAKLS